MKNVSIVILELCIIFSLFKSFSHITLLYRSITDDGKNNLDIMNSEIIITKMFDIYMIKIMVMRSMLESSQEDLGWAMRLGEEVKVEIKSI